MSFCYYTRPLPGGQRFTGQTAETGARETEDVLAALAAHSGVSLVEVRAVMESFGQYVVQQTMDCWRINPILDWFGFMPSCGGSHPTNDFAPTFKNLAVDLKMTKGKKAVHEMELRFNAVNVGHNPTSQPRIVRVTNMHTGVENTYTPGKPLQVEVGSPCCAIDYTVAQQGIFFTSAAGANVRAADYGYNKGSVFVCVVPTGLTGQQQISVSGILYKTLRKGTYGQWLTLQTATASPEDAPHGNGNGRATTRAGKGHGQNVALPS